MGELLGLNDLEPRDAIVLVLALPYLLLALGRLVPYRQVKDWRDLYFGSEASRERALSAMERGADAIEATRTLVEATLIPLQKAARDDDEDDQISGR
jgi:hypothetical protein